MNSKGSEWRRWDLHLHTSSSYDYEYNSNDADSLLIQTLLENEIAAVAITDHFVIDAGHIERLRGLTTDIVFFPGVELRTDKGDTNIHVILIFSNGMDLKILEEDFNVFKRQKAKNEIDVQKIYWDFKDIVTFAEEHKALVSIHAGSKTSGVDDKISNALPINQAIKEEYAQSVHFFEMGKSKDLSEYRKFVFSDIEEKPMIMCSDNHDPRKYNPKESLWIKADITFEGLKQCLFQPEERVYVGTIPPALDRARKNEKLNIANIAISKIENSKNTSENWFSANLNLNSGLVAVIGNKGSGKSAFSDIVGHLCKCTTMGKASFLNNTRFRKLPKNYAGDYKASITWSDGHKEENLLSDSVYKTTIEDAQYLPQKYIEDVCNDIDNEFQNEINKVIFSYVDQTERGNAKNLEELIENKAKIVYMSIDKVEEEISCINKKIIGIEEKITSQYRIYIQDSLKKLTEDLNRHESSKPTEVRKPEEKIEDREYQNQLQSLNSKIEEINSMIEKKRSELTNINIRIDEVNQLILQIQLLENNVTEVNQIIHEFIMKHELQEIEQITLTSPIEELQKYMRRLFAKKTEINVLINGINQKDGLLYELSEKEKQKVTLISNADAEEKRYQKYLSDLSDWVKERERIIGNDKIENTMRYFESELEYLKNGIDQEYNSLKNEREELIKKVFTEKQKLVNIYRDIYSPIEKEIEKLLGDMEEGIAFGAEIQLIDNTIADSLLIQVNQKFAGMFKGKAESSNKMGQLLRKTEFDNIESIMIFIREVLHVVDEDMDISSKKIISKQDFYNLLCSLSYIGVAYKLKMGERELEELSPGERGIVLLVFYLALSKNNIPIIIDQPEDNLDNQSVFSKLVPCICEAKKKRQVIIVTHNPNIAIACDAEQIIYCRMNKTTHEIKYKSGAIEDVEMRKCVVDVLEGTYPAFDLRKKKYFS